MIINAIGGNGRVCFYIQELASELGEKNMSLSFYEWSFEKDEQANFKVINLFFKVILRVTRKLW